MKRAILIIGGIGWLMTGGLLGWLLVRYVANGAGADSFGLSISPGSVLLGTAHVVGIFLASGFSIVLGIGWCAFGLASSSSPDKPESSNRPS